MDEIIYKTVIRNDRKKEGVVIWARNGDGIGIVPPGEERTLETDNHEALYSAFSEIVHKADGTVEVKANPDYPEPKGRWKITCLNIAGREIERRIINGVERILPKGLPRTFALDPEDRHAIYERLEIKEVMERVPSREWKFYNEFRRAIKDVLSDRPDDELQALAAELEKLAQEII